MTDLTSARLSRLRLGLSWPLLVALLAYAIALLRAPQTIGDPDVYWHVVTGRWIIAHHAVPHVDIFSYSMPGAPWVAHEWLADVALALLFDHFGWLGLVALAGAAGGLALAALARVLLRHLPPLYALMATMLAMAMCAPHWLARPHIFTLPLAVLWVTALVEAREADRAPPLALALIMTLWVNLHGSFIVGLGFAGLLGFEALLLAPSAPARWLVVRRWGVFGALAFAATFITPNGINAYLLPVHLLGMKYTLSILREWRSASFEGLEPFEIWLLVALFLGFGTKLRLPMTRLLLLLLLVHLALQHVRHGELVGLIAPLLLAPAIGAQLKGAPSGGDSAWLDRKMAELARPAAAPAVALALALALAGNAIAVTYPIAPPKIFTPEAALRFARAHGIEGHVLNDYNFGGYLIFSGVPTFVDGRADMYGDAFIEREHEAVHAQNGELPAILGEYDVTWTLLAPSNEAVRLLDLMPGWHRVYADDIAVIHIRDGVTLTP